MLNLHCVRGNDDPEGNHGESELPGERGPGPLLEDGVSADRCARDKDSVFCSEEAEVRWEENQVGIHFLREESG